MLPQLMIVAGMSVALWVAARWVWREVARVDLEMRRRRLRWTASRMTAFRGCNWIPKLAVITRSNISPAALATLY